jgi:RHS repeat-associated protein
MGNGLQATDYVYTINGWLKSINSPDLDKTRDPGHDGTKTSANHFAADYFGMSLDYFSGDYVRSNTYVQSFGDASANTLATNLYNGIIKSQRWKTATQASWTSLQHTSNELFYGYKYDKQYQLTEANFGNIATVGSTNDNTPSSTYEGPLLTASTDYKVFNLTYDPNGNIQTLKRNAYGTNLAMDQLTYSYNSNNQLNKVVDAITSNNYNNLELQPNQGANNYTYNQIGQMIGDDNADLYYEYNAYGLVTGTYKNSNHTTALMKIDYNERGQRLKKTSYDASGTITGYTWYVRDVSGNIISLYEESIAPSAIALHQTDLSVNGVGRLGTFSRGAIAGAMYELNDHLGNVRSTFNNDKLTTITTGFEGTAATDYLVDFDNAHLQNMTGPGGTTGTSVKTSFRKKFGGGINNIEVHPGDVINASFYFKCGEGDAAYFNAMLVYDLYNEQGQKIPTESYFASTGPKTNDNWNQKTASYIVNPALTGSKYTCKVYLLNNYIFLHPTTVYFDDLSVTVTGNANSGLDIPAQQSLTDYYPHGSLLPGRSAGSNGYRYDYQGQFSEKDAVSGQNAFEARMYSSILGRWNTIDGAKQFSSPYLAMANCPTMVVDRDGRFAQVLIGAGVGALINVGGAILSGDISLEGLANFDGDEWAKLGVTAAVGAVEGAVLSTGAGGLLIQAAETATGKIVMNTIVAGSINAITEVTNQAIINEIVPGSYKEFDKKSGIIGSGSAILSGLGYFFKGDEYIVPIMEGGINWFSSWFTNSEEPIGYPGKMGALTDEDVDLWEAELSKLDK